MKSFAANIYVLILIAYSGDASAHANENEERILRRVEHRRAKKNNHRTNPNRNLTRRRIQTQKEYTANLGTRCDAPNADTIFNFRAEDYDECQSECDFDPECLAFEYDPSSGLGERNCRLFDFIPLDLEEDPTSPSDDLAGGGAAARPVPRPTNPPPTRPPPTAPPPTNPPPTAPPPTAAPPPCVGDLGDCKNDADCCGGNKCYNFDTFIIKLGKKCSSTAPLVRRLMHSPLMDWMADSVDNSDGDMGKEKDRRLMEYSQVDWIGVSTEEEYKAWERGSKQSAKKASKAGNIRLGVEKDRDSDGELDEQSRRSLRRIQQQGQDVACYTAKLYTANFGQSCDALDSDAIASITTDREGCAGICTTNRDCMAFEYDLTDSGNNCKLFDFVPGTIKSPAGTTSNVVSRPVPRPTNPPPTRPPPTAPPPTNPPPTNPPPTAPPPTAPAKACVGEFAGCANDSDCCGNNKCYNFDNFLIKLGNKCSATGPQIRRLMEYPLMEWMSDTSREEEEDITADIESNEVEAPANTIDNMRKEDIVSHEGMSRHRRAQRNGVACYTKMRSMNGGITASLVSGTAGDDDTTQPSTDTTNAARQPTRRPTSRIVPRPTRSPTVTAPGDEYSSYEYTVITYNDARESSF